jgi:hypothetical protein
MEQDIGATFRRLGVIYAADDAVSVDMNVLGIPLGVNVEPALIDSGRKFIDIELELVGKFLDLGSDDVFQRIERGGVQKHLAVHDCRINLTRPIVGLGVGLGFHQLIDALAKLIVQGFRAFDIRNLNKDREKPQMLTYVGQR